jgi:hypothetical protein
MMTRYTRNGSSASSMTPSVAVGRPTAQYTVKDAVRMVRDSWLETITKFDMVERKVTWKNEFILPIISISTLVCPNKIYRTIAPQTQHRWLWMASPLNKPLGLVRWLEVFHWVHSTLESRQLGKEAPTMITYEKQMQGELVLLLTLLKTWTQQEWYCLLPLILTCDP